MIFYKTNHNDNKFGIDVYHNGKLIMNVCDITDKKSDAEKLVNLFNELNIELCHFYDVIEDYLTDFDI